MARENIDQFGTIMSGKFEGESVEDVALEYPSYVKYMLDAWNLSEEEREMAQKAYDLAVSDD